MVRVTSNRLHAFKGLLATSILLAGLASSVQSQQCRDDPGAFHAAERSLRQETCLINEESKWMHLPEFQASATPSPRMGSEENTPPPVIKVKGSPWTDIVPAATLVSAGEVQPSKQSAISVKFQGTSSDASPTAASCIQPASSLSTTGGTTCRSENASNIPTPSTKSFSTSSMVASDPPIPLHSSAPTTVLHSTRADETSPPSTFTTPSSASSLSSPFVVSHTLTSTPIPKKSNASVSQAASPSQSPVKASPTLATNVSSTASVVQPTTLSGNISKERFNYASFDCGAIMLAHNREASSANAILHNNKDAYMLNKCSAKRFIIIEMCEDILVEVIMLANFEFFSSMFKDFEVSVADRYPPKGDEWTSLGQFRAKNVRDYQYFKVPNPKIWTRYLKVSFLSDYGHEYYCPLTLLRVYGTTMMEEMKIEDEASGTLMGISKTSTERVKPLNTPAPNHQHAQKKLPLTDLAKVRDRWPTPHSSVGFPAIDNTILHSNWRKTPAAEKEPFTYIKEQFYSMMSSEPENQYSEGAPSSRASGTPQSSNDGEDIRSDETADTSSSPPATGGTQESIFKQILKRLSLLERNSTMSYIYLEEQSKLLNDIFSHAGFREQERFDALLHHYNRTLLNIFSDLHMEYSRTWSMLFSELEVQTLHLNGKMDEIENLLVRSKTQMSIQLYIQSFFAVLVTGLVAYMLPRLRSPPPAPQNSKFAPISPDTPAPQPPSINPPTNPVVESPVDQSPPQSPIPTPVADVPALTVDTSLVGRDSSPSPEHYPRAPISTPTERLHHRVSSDTKLPTKKKRKRRRSTIVPPPLSPFHGMETSRSENDIFLLEQQYRARRGSLSPTMFRLLENRKKMESLSGIQENQQSKNVKAR